LLLKLSKVTGGMWLGMWNHDNLPSSSVCWWAILTILETELALQDFTILPTEKFRRCVIRSSSVIFLPTSSPMDYVYRLFFRRWFPLPSLYRSEKQKNHLLMVLQTEFARQKKKIPSWNIPTDLYSVGDIVIYRRKLIVDKFVGECMKYRPNLFICKFIGTCGNYC